MRLKIFTGIGLAGSILASAFGGWDAALETLMLMMAADWITGGIILPVFFGNSPKSASGTLESRAGWKGMCRKGMTLLYVMIAARLDNLMGTTYLRNAVCIGFIANEALSVMENAALMGVPLPDVLKKVIGVLKDQSGGEHYGQNS